MQRFLNMDNPIWRFMGHVADAVLLTFLWAIGSLPIVTIGASTMALYTVSMQIVRGQDGYLCRTFFRAYRQYWKQGTVMGLLLLLSGVILAGAGWFYWSLNSALGALLLPSVLILGLLFCMITVYAFPLMALYCMSNKQILQAAFVLALKNIGWTAFMLISLVAIPLLGVYWAAPLLVFSAGGTALLNSWSLKMLLGTCRLPYEERQLLQQE